MTANEVDMTNGHDSDENDETVIFAVISSRRETTARSYSLHTEGVIKSPSQPPPTLFLALLSGWTARLQHPFHQIEAYA